ncbi:glycosyltransferase family protein [Saccharibacillus alkalitolerans]|uniref:Methyltransferase domain-containing protein n=1 Tax=Saccharibacillus alkalitolerans TaxID=2705290 RepID=A0ABX0F6U5_9BACL|nr:methyltransferase domain-containing protein [Saccharibacillus alkalitolerans]NGZ76105.1 methyltransferase domain-containing protein [Saccharibacillus alkalitolerans]
MKILIFKGPGIIAPHIIQDYADAFQEKGYEIGILDLTQKFDLKDVVNFAPDLVIGYGYVGVFRTGDNHFLLRELNIPVVCLHYDNPFFGLNTAYEEEFMRYPEYYFHFIWDQTYLEAFQAKKIENCHKIMLATNPSRFTPLLGEVPTKGRISFVGSIYEEAKKDEDTIEELFIQFILAQKLKNIEIPVMNLCYKAFELPEFEPIALLFKNHPEVFWKQIYYSIHQVGSKEYRKYMIGSLEGIDVHVYGNGWKSGNDIVAHPSVPYAELSSLYQSYEINLNISSLQLETSVNNRIFDGFASKAFVLSDYKKDMELVFPDLWKYISFTNLEDLVSKADYFLTHPKEKKELIDVLYEIVLNKHTYAHRVEEIMEVILDKQGTSQRNDSAPIANLKKYDELTEQCPLCQALGFTLLHSIEGHDHFVTNLHRCSNCAAVFMNPRPTEEYLEWFYNEVYYSEAHRKKMGWSTDLSEVSAGALRNYEVRMDLVESFTNQTKFPRGRLLDIGCSTGNFLLEARSRYWDVQGIEVSDKAAEKGRANYDLDILSGVLNNRTFEDSSFDAVTAWDVLEHIAEPHEFMENINRILKPGGLLALNTPNVSSTASYHSSYQWRHLDPPLHVILYDHISLRILLKMYGLEILKISSGSEYLGQLQVVARKPE